MGTAVRRTSWEPIVAVAALLSLALWPIQIHRAFGLPAHPLIIHVPVIFIPILGLTVLAVMFNFRWFERYGTLVAAFSVVSLAATLLAVGAGEAFKEDRERFFPMNDPTLHDHADAGITVRLVMLILTAILVGLLFARRLPNAARIALRVLAVLFALARDRDGRPHGPPGREAGLGRARGRPAAGIAGSAARHRRLVDNVNDLVDTVNEMADPEQIAALRDFNRFYTSRLGMTRHGLHSTTHPLAEARVLYELGAHGTLQTSALKDALAIDAGQLSRLVKRLQEQGLIERAPSPTDARRQQVRLTPHGEEAFARLDAGSKEEVGQLLDALPDPHAALRAMQHLRAAIEPTRNAADPRAADRRPRLAGRAPRRPLCARVRLGRVLRAPRGADRRRLRPRHRPRVGRGGQRRARRRRAVRARHAREREAAHAARRAQRPRPRPRHAPRRPGDRAREPARLPHARRCGPTTSCTPRARSTSAPASRSSTRRRTTRSATTLIEQTWSLTLQPWTETH